MRYVLKKVVLAIVFILLLDTVAAQSPGGYSHDRFGTQPRDHVRELLPFTVSFDTEDDGRARGVPEWVAYELRRKPEGFGPGPSRPSKWKTDPVLHQRKVAPNDATYRGSGYDLAHLCMKSHAWRLGREADRASHTILNACPQLHFFNAGIWLGLELLTGEWADIYGKIWVIAGPVFYSNMEVKTIGDKGEVPADIPHAFFKVVIRENAKQELSVLAFLFPHQESGSLRRIKAPLLPYLVSVDHLENLTGLDFLTSLPDEIEEGLESVSGRAIWPGGGISSKSGGERPGEDVRPPAARKGQTGLSTRTLKLRGGITPAKAQLELAKGIQAAGWLYVMPVPKSSKAKWGNYDRRTTWWRDYWINIRTGRVSSKIPSKENAFAGDGVDIRGWRSGGSPREKPTVIEWLCSESNGIKP